MVYVDEKPIILACDDTAYVKMLPELSDLMADAEVGCPYDGAREHYILDTSHREHVQKVVSTLLPIIPFPKKRAKK